MGLYHRPYWFCQLVPWNGYTTAIGWPAPAMYGQHHCQTWALQLVCAKKNVILGELGWAGVKAIMASHVFLASTTWCWIVLPLFVLQLNTTSHHWLPISCHLGVMQISWTQSHWHYHKSTFSRLQTCRLLMWFACTFKFIPVPLWTFFSLIHSHSSA